MFCILAPRAAMAQAMPLPYGPGISVETARFKRPTKAFEDVLASELALSADRRTCSVAVTNTGDRPIQVGSHYPFDETNRALALRPSPPGS
jgi:hypothetical protein